MMTPPINLAAIAASMKTYWDLTPEDADFLAFHLGDAYEDWKKLIPLLERAGEVESEELGDEVLGMLQHTPNHLVAAAKLMNQVTTDVWNLGITIAPGSPD